jgi:hypothetical protein
VFSGQKDHHGKQRRTIIMLPLWPLLFLIASFQPVLSGLHTGGKAGIAGTLVGVGIGLVIGTAWFFGLLAMRRWHLRCTANMSPAWATILTIVAYICAPLSGIAPWFIVQQLVRLIFCL